MFEYGDYYESASLDYGETYAGDFKDEKPNGRGKKTYSDGTYRLWFELKLFSTSARAATLCLPFNLHCPASQKWI